MRGEPENPHPRSTIMSNESRIKYLEAEIERHSALYYAHQPEISDDAFDALRDELEELAPDSPVLAKVGSESLAEGWDKAAHTIPMGSQAKVNSAEEFLKWAERTGAERFACEDKLDGLSLEVKYVDGRFVAGITRGDGFEGEDITRNVAKMQNVPAALPVGVTCSLRGEIILPLSTFDAKYAGEYKNPRNAAAGIARRLDGTNSEDLVVKYFDVIIEGREFKTEEDKLCYITTRMGLEVATFFVPLTAEQVVKLYEKYQADIRDTLDWEIDGLVVKCNDIQTQEDLGTTNDNRPRGQVAIKFASRKKVTYLEDVVWEVGNTGRLTPVAIVEPVNLSGVTISRVTLHNVEEFEKHKLFRGAPVLISRANDVIPYFHGIVDGMPPKQSVPQSVPTAAPVQSALWD